MPRNLVVQALGGPGAWMRVLRSVGGFENALVTKKIEIATRADMPTKHGNTRNSIL